MLLRKEEEEVHNEEEGLKACNDSGRRTRRDEAGADSVDSCEIDATLKRSGDRESLPGNYGENVCN